MTILHLLVGTELLAEWLISITFRALSIHGLRVEWCKRSSLLDSEWQIRICDIWSAKRNLNIVVWVFIVHSLLG